MRRETINLTAGLAATTLAIWIGGCAMSKSGSNSTGVPAAGNPAAGEVISVLVKSAGAFVNNDKLPLVVYRNVLPEGEGAPWFEEHFTANRWPSMWRAGLYNYQHYHSVAHEALGVYSGEAKVQFGGPAGPVHSVTRGDVVVIPAGVAHKLVSSAGGFTVVGAYPRGQSPDMQYGREGERPGVDAAIAKVPLPTADPVEGGPGSLLKLWK